VPDSRDIKRQLAALARDRVSGATALARRAARILGAAARDDGRSLARWQRDLRAVAGAVVAAQPVMASLATVAALALREAVRARTVEEGTHAVRRALAGYVRGQPRAVARAAARLATLLPLRATVMTISSSAVVLEALLVARRRGRLARVVVAESRPGGEGVRVARRLCGAGIEATVIVDALAPAMAREVDAVVVGADAVTKAVVWNKCGTLALALGARAARRSFYVVTTEDRLVGRVAVQGSHAGGLFDATPLALVSRVVTERGASSTSRVPERLTPGCRRGLGPSHGVSRLPANRSHRPG
jgi:translation initiation factor 2B subunit (eIF-2B alpha/beta/delta family)